MPGSALNCTTPFIHVTLYKLLYLLEVEVSWESIFIRSAQAAAFTFSGARSFCYASQVCRWRGLMPSSPLMQLNAIMLDARASCGKPTLQLRWLSKRAAWNLKNFETRHSAANALSLQVCQCVIYLPRDSTRKSCCHIILLRNKQLGTRVEIKSGPNFWRSAITSSLSVNCYICALLGDSSWKWILQNCCRDQSPRRDQLSG